MKWVVTVCTACAAACGSVTPSHAQESITGRAFTERMIGASADSISIEIETLAPGLHVLFGAGGNVLVSIGQDGVLMVDDQLDAMTPKIKSAIQSLGGSNVAFLINTHWHYDHVDGNAAFGKAGSWIVAHENTRVMMTNVNLINMAQAVVRQPAYPPEGLPVITYASSMRFSFNAQQIDLVYFGPAHTSGDTAVFFRERDVVHLGDVFHTRRYPFIDTDHGGDLDGMISFCEAVLMRTGENAVMVPGHGPVSRREDLEEYVRMLRTVRQRVGSMIDNGFGIDEIINASPTSDWDEQRGDPTRFLHGVFASLSRNGRNPASGIPVDAQ